MKRALVLALLLAAGACSGSDGPTEPSGGNENPPTNNPPTNNPPPTNPPTTGAQTHTITLESASFSPSSLTIKAGDTVVWTNSASIFHTVTPQGHAAWSSASTSAPGEVMRMTFNTPGSYAFFCQPHSGTMTGVIIVQ
jgi:plastocyanin